VSGSTTYEDPSVTTATLADVNVGDHVAVFGTDTDNTVTATKVAIGGPGGPGHADGPGGGHGPSFGGTPPAAFGTVASVGTDTFTLTSRDGTTVTVKVSGSTTYEDPSVTTATLADVKVGDHVAVFGTDTDNTVTATKVAVGGPGGPGQGGGPGPGGPGQGGPGGFGGPGGGRWAPSTSKGTSSSGAASSGGSTTSNAATSGSDLN